MTLARPDWLRDLPLTRDLPSAAIARLAQRSERRQVRRRVILWSPGDRADHVFWVHTGVIRVGLAPQTPRELTLDFHARQALLGEAPLLLGGDHAGFAQAYEDSTIYHTPAREIARLIERQPLFARHLATLLAGRKARIERRMGALLGQDSLARLAHVLLELGDRFGVRDSRGLIINLKVTHRELASMIGTSRETVGHGLHQLRQAAWIAVEGKRVILLDVEALRRAGGAR